MASSLGRERARPSISARARLADIPRYPVRKSAGDLGRGVAGGPLRALHGAPRSAAGVHRDPTALTSAEVSPQLTEAFLRECTRHGLMAADGDRYLSLALTAHRPPLLADSERPHTAEARGCAAT